MESDCMFGKKTEMKKILWNIFLTLSFVLGIWLIIISTIEIKENPYMIFMFGIGIFNVSIRVFDIIHSISKILDKIEENELYGIE